MSNSIELRCPFLDQEMVELACKVPFDLKVRGNEFKYILKRAAEKLIPTENVYRKKIGFSVPLHKWFRRKLNSYTESLLFRKNSYMAKLFNRDYIYGMLKNHNERNDFGPQLWSLLTLELWVENSFN